jgi:hypothetical protein
MQEAIPAARRLVYILERRPLLALGRVSLKGAV